MLSVVNQGNLASPVRIFPGIPFSLKIRMLLFSRYREGIQHMRVSCLVSGAKEEGGGQDQSDLPISSIFSNSFRWKYSLCQGPIFRGSVSWTLYQWKILKHWSCLSYMKNISGTQIALGYEGKLHKQINKLIIEGIIRWEKSPFLILTK